MSEEEDLKNWVYTGGLPFELTEGDIVCVFSQFGEITEMTLSRDRDTGRSRGFGFIKYEDPRSSELAVDNFNGATIVGRRIKVSFASNTQALRNRKPANIAPNEQSTLPIVENRRKQLAVSRSPEARSKSRRSRSRSPAGDGQDNHDRTRSRSNHKAMEPSYNDNRRRPSPIERRNYRDSDNYNRHDRNDSNYDRDNRNGNDYDRRDRQVDYRKHERDSGRTYYRDSSSSHKWGDSRDRADQYRSRHSRDDYNGERSHNRNTTYSDHSRQSKTYRRSDRRSRSMSRSRSRSVRRSPPPRSPPERPHFKDRKDHYYQSDRRHQQRTRYNSGDRNTYN